MIYFEVCFLVGFWSFFPLLRARGINVYFPLLRDQTYRLLIGACDLALCRNWGCRSALDLGRRPGVPQAWVLEGVYMGADGDADLLGPGRVPGSAGGGTATSTSFWTISRAFVSSTSPHARRVLQSTWCLC